MANMTITENTPNSNPWWYPGAPVESYLVIDDGSNGSLIEIPPLVPAVIPGIGPLPFPEVQDKRPFAALFDGSVEQKPGCLEKFAEQCEERRDERSRELKQRIIEEMDEETDNEDDVLPPPTTPPPSPESETMPPPHHHKMTRSGHHY